MSKDWKGNRVSAVKQLASSYNSDVEREQNDFYATDPNTVELLFKALQRDGVTLADTIWECACGQGHISEKLIEHGHEVISTDLIDRGYGSSRDMDFLQFKGDLPPGVDILTNPPYKFAQEFVEKALESLHEGQLCVMLLKIQFLEGKGRRPLFEKSPPKYVYVNSERQMCYLNGDLSTKMSSACCYCWFIWEKGYKGEPTIRWI